MPADEVLRLVAGGREVTVNALSLSLDTDSRMVRMALLSAAGAGLVTVDARFVTWQVTEAGHAAIQAASR